MMMKKKKKNQMMFLCSIILYNINNCEFRKRNGIDKEFIERELESDNKKHEKGALIHMDISDNIHTFLIHGYDTDFIEK